MQSLLKISDAVNLAMHACAILSGNPEKIMSAKALSASMEASEATLTKAMQRLVRAGIVNSTRGPSGGFRLAISADRISLKSIVEAVDGPLVPPGCLFGRRICGLHECMLGDTALKAHQILVERLESTCLDKVAMAARVLNPEDH